jgi:hypothetical protein
MEICTTCFYEGRYPLEMSSSDFMKVVLFANSEDIWAEGELNKLLLVMTHIF